MVEIIDNSDPLKKLVTDRQLHRHHQRLSEISNIKIKFGEKFSMNQRKAGEYPNEQLLKQRHHYMEYNTHFNKNAKQTEISKDNTKILQKLVNIHLGRGNNGSISNLHAVDGSRNYYTANSPFNPQTDRTTQSKGGRFKKKRNTMNGLGMNQSFNSKDRSKSELCQFPKTFHSISRQNEDKRIMADNMKIVKRIFGI